MTPTIDTAEGVAWHLDALTARVPALQPMRQSVGVVLPRVNPKGFAGMAKVICGQQLSVASARAIWGRVEGLGAVTAPAYLAFDEPTLRATGLSRGKYETIRGLALAIEAGTLDFGLIDDMPAPLAIETLTQLKGIGPWTAEIYLLFCAGHPDVFPAGDLALQKAVAHAFDLPERPQAKALIDLSDAWSPHRGAAALMFWRDFSAMKNSDAWDAL